MSLGPFIFPLYNVYIRFGAEFTFSGFIQISSIMPNHYMKTSMERGVSGVRVCILYHMITVFRHVNIVKMLSVDLRCQKVDNWYVCYASSLFFNFIHPNVFHIKINKPDMWPVLKTVEK